MTAHDTSTKTVTALLEGVTPGPWRATFDEATKILARDGSVAMLMYVNTKGRRDANQVGASARFIAAARELVPALSAERDRLAAQVVQLQRDLDAAISWAVKVKPLEWGPSPDPLCHDHWEASALVGAHHMAPDEDSASGAWLLQLVIRRKDFCTKYGGDITSHGSPEDAKAAAQADYEARILSALEKPHD